MKILDGKKLNGEIRDQLSEKISDYTGRGFSVPGLAIIQIGDNQSSNVYVGRKRSFAESIGAKCNLFKLPENTKEDQVISLIADLNANPQINGIILQLPIPHDINPREIINQIDPQKDVDGLCDTNLSKLINNDPSGITPATATGIIYLLKSNQIEIQGKRVTIIGRSVLVGKTTAMKMLNEDATVKICHSKTKNLQEEIKEPDIIVVATGNPGTITGMDLQDHQIVVDVGISVVDGKISGDVTINGDSQSTPAALSPVPGGVGPMTVAALFLNLIKTYESQIINK
jgi:methylenetetrahydrofolate dehydrogenase (NADP+)/methenyltetrahydrofolate cyclohydrolase